MVIKNIIFQKDIYFLKKLDVVENPKAYKIDIKETKKVLFLRHADKDKKFEISFVSNGRLENSEFVNWLDKMELVKI